MCFNMMYLFGYLYIFSMKGSFKYFCKERNRLIFPFMKQHAFEYFYSAQNTLNIMTNLLKNMI